MPITYEQPLNEKMRTFLRLEFLFLQAEHTLEGDSVWDNRATLSGILDILTICGRSDLKTDLLKELERYAANLMRLENAAGVDGSMLESVLSEIDLLIDRLHAIEGQPAQELRQNEFLNSIKQRSFSPGGVCDFDLPAYHFWLKRPFEARMRDLRAWLGVFDAVRLATKLIMRLTRESASPKEEIALDGFFQKSLTNDMPIQMVRVKVPSDSPFYAEISGGKHRFSVRFMQPSPEGSARQASEDINFYLTCCGL